MILISVQGENRTRQPVTTFLQQTKIWINFLFGDFGKHRNVFYLLNFRKCRVYTQRLVDYCSDVMHILHVTLLSTMIIHYKTCYLASLIETYHIQFQVFLYRSILYVHDILKYVYCNSYQDKITCWSNNQEYNVHCAGKKAMLQFWITEILKGEMIETNKIKNFKICFQ